MIAGRDWPDALLVIFTSKKVMFAMVHTTILHLNYAELIKKPI